MTKTVEAKEIGLDPIEVSDSIGMQKKVAETQEKLAKLGFDEQDKFTKATRDANIISKLDKEKSEDVRTMERYTKEYGVDLGPFDKDLWSLYSDLISNKIEYAMASVMGDLLPKRELATIELQLTFIEDLAGINTKAKKEKFENSELVTNKSVNKVYSRLIHAIMNVPEDAEETEEDSKSNS